MKRIVMMSAVSALGFAIAHGPAVAGEAAMAKLVECMKMKPATPEQDVCLKAVETLRAQQPAKAKSTAAAPPPTPKAKSVAAPGSAPKVIALPPHVKSAAAKVHLNGVSPANGVPKGDLRGLDPSTAMTVVQRQRENLHESRLEAQMYDIRKRNDQIVRLNTLIADLKKFRPAGTDKQKWGNLGANTAEGKALYARLQSAGVAIPTTGDDRVDEPGTGIYDARQKTFDVWTEQIKGKIDALSSSQQRDMLRMESLTNETNAALDVIADFVKQSQDAQASMASIFENRPN